MVYAFTLPTTSPLSFQCFIFSSTHPSLPQSASAARHALRLALKTHKRLPRGPRQDAHLPAVLSALNEYLPYLFAISHGLRGKAVQPVPSSFEAQDGGGIDDAFAGIPRSGEEIEITSHAEFVSSWKPTLSTGISLNIGNTGVEGKSLRARGGRVAGKGIDFELAFTLSTLGYVLCGIARNTVTESIYASKTPSPEQRAAAVQSATRHLLQASSVHVLLATSPVFAAATASSVPDINASTQSGLSSLALAEATLVAVLKDDAYITACIQSRNPNDKEWMVRAPEIPKVRALLFARLCVRAAEYAEQAAASLGTVGSGSGRSGRIDEEVIRYADVLGRVARARACRFFGVDAELAGKVGEGIAWLQAARSPLGLRGGGTLGQPTEEAGKTSSKGGFSRLKREWTERREERKIGKDAGAGRGNAGVLEPGDDAGRDEEGRVITMLETKWVRMNDTINTQLIPSSAPLLASLPSGRDIHAPPAPFTPPSLDQDQLRLMRAPPDETQVFHFNSDPDDSEDNGDSGDTRGPPGAFPDRSQTASNVYY
ncbi:hypothetical protein N7492_002250 [Penicillium capsulatum]|uniref:pH-response regulator protein palC n=1 Tax=Penicillium capsulatum TaxID=69766 RepID=A0A9W9IL54_9EURO|nr:hypothetical protein N7492_002250 [Penicillium capsulatum]KAJ6123145.1 hypothetical protein N7512_005610 [Penicillium capsulatum]